MITNVVALLAGLFVLSLGPAWAGDDPWPEDALDAADRYLEGNYREAAEGYRDAITAGDPRPELSFNLGNALYRSAGGDSARLAEAFGAYQRAAAGGDATLRARALHNSASTTVWSGSLAEAEAQYRDVLRQDPTDDRARYNLELVQRILESQPPDSSGQSSEDSQSDESQPGDQPPEESDRQDQEPQDEGDDNPESPPEDSPPQDEQEQPDPGEEGQPPEGEPPPPEDTPPPEQTPGEEEPSISPEEARRELDKLDEVERDLLRQLLRARRRKIDVEKDW